MQNAMIKLSLEERIFEKKAYVENNALKKQLNLVLGERAMCGRAEIEIKLKNNSIIKTEFFKEEEWGIITHDEFSTSEFLFSQIEEVVVLNSKIEILMKQEEINA